MSGRRGNVPAGGGGGSAFAWNEVDAVVWLQVDLPDARAAFSTRLGGVSEAPFDSLNLGILTPDEPQLVARNRRTLARALGRDPASLVFGRQVHGAGVQVHDGPADGAPPSPSDVQVTGSAALTPLVLVADCLPLTVSAPGAVAMAHCGWRGIVAGAVATAVEAVLERSGARPAQLHAALGPGIRSCCYRVGEEVRDAFERRGHPHALRADGALDLAGAARAELERCEVGGERLLDCGLCTSCDGGRFFSHRRDGGVTGRQGGLAWLSS